MSFYEQFKDYFMADKDIQDERMAICRGCKFLTPKFRCTQCGCFMKVKTKIAGMSCPEGKW
jgi:hypothetical protein|tara:strand:- start:11124 stop:11306 length:183 start_codon:yes stop_codon:yes gene_type:complete